MVDVEAKLQEDLPNENSLTLPKDAVGKGQRYSFGMKRDTGPLGTDPSALKTISLADVCPVVNPTSSNPLTTKTTKRKPSQKVEEDVSRKTQQRRNEKKKVDLALTDGTIEIGRGRITRSSAKPTD